jgi:apolipoprotein D and lipocalin family protein
MTRRVVYGIIVVIMLITMAAHAQQPMQELKTVDKVDLDRYVGKWYEVARFPNRFQTKCTGEVTANYTKREDGRIDVINQCRTLNGSMTEAVGVACVVDTSSNARLKVRFAPAWLGWLPMVWGDYWIIALADDYSYAVIGEPGRNYLWILSRTPSMPEKSWLMAVRQAQTQGFDVAKLIRTNQGI